MATQLGPTNRRDLFLSAAEAFARWKSGPLPTVLYDGEEVDMLVACSRVINDAGIFPGGTLLDELQETLGFKSRTFAAVARALRRHVKTRGQFSCP
jgi:hypothetical protein